MVTARRHVYSIRSESAQSISLQNCLNCYQPGLGGENKCFSNKKNINSCFNYKGNYKLVRSNIVDKYISKRSRVHIAYIVYCFDKVGSLLTFFYI